MTSPQSKPLPARERQRLSKKQRVLVKEERAECWWSSSSSEMGGNKNDQSDRGRSTSEQNSPSESEDSMEPVSSRDTNFVNHASILWSEKRQEWVGSKPREQRTRAREPVINWNTTYGDLLTTSRPFPKPVPLPEMVDFLEDVWEQLGLYDC